MTDGEADKYVIGDVRLTLIFDHDIQIQSIKPRLILLFLNAEWRETSQRRLSVHPSHNGNDRF